MGDGEERKGEKSGRGGGLRKMGKERERNGEKEGENDEERGMGRERETDGLIRLLFFNCN